MDIAEMTVDDYEDAFSLWQRCEGIGLSDADEFEPLSRFLEMNRGLCFTARMDGDLVGTCLCGSDGRRGYLYHLAVDPQVRRQGIGKQLVEKTLQVLQERGIHKCHIMVYSQNSLGLTFWKQTGWVLRPEITLMSYSLSTEQKGCPC